MVTGKLKFKGMRRALAFALVFALVLGVMPVMASADEPDSSAGNVTVRIEGRDETIIDNHIVAIEDLIAYMEGPDGDLTPEDGNKLPNALDAVIFATLQNGYSKDSFEIEYNSNYESYSINRLVNHEKPSDWSWYWGNIAVNPTDGYDSGSLSGREARNGDKYIVYVCDNDDPAWFTNNRIYAISGVPIEVAVHGMASDWSSAEPKSGLTIYAVGGEMEEPTPIAITDMDGKASLIFKEADTYILNISDGYTYTESKIIVTGEKTDLFNVDIDIYPSDALLAVKDDQGMKYSPYEIIEGVHKYRLPEGNYIGSLNKNGYLDETLSFDVKKDTEIEIILSAAEGYYVEIRPGNPDDETIKVYDSIGQEVEKLENESPWAYDLVNGSYRYTISRDGYHSIFGEFIVEGNNLLIENISALSDKSANNPEWEAFRNHADNMAVVNSETATGFVDASEKWSISLGELGAWGSLSSSNLVIFDGYIYVSTEHGITKIEKQTGKIVVTMPLSADIGYAPQIAYGDGKLFVSTSAGIDAFDALNMERLWSSAFDDWDSPYMVATPILYYNDTIFAGNYGSGDGKYGGYSAFDPMTGQTRGTLYGSESMSFYWSGAVPAGDYLVFGGQDSKIRAISFADINPDNLNQYGGLDITPSTLVVDSAINSSVAYYQDKLYFTTKTGILYAASLNQETGELALIKSNKFAAASSSTPTVHNGRVYVGGSTENYSGKLYVLDASTLEEIYAIPVSAQVQSSALLTTAYEDSQEGKVYGYFTSNDGIGGVFVFSDMPDQAEPVFEELYVPNSAEKKNYCLNSVIADSEGTLYYTNDSGFLFAIENLEADTTLKARVVFDINPAFKATGSKIDYPEINLYDSEDYLIRTAVPGKYYLEEGEYSYTVKLSGYNTASKTFRVERADWIGGKTISVILEPATNDKDPNADIRVFLTLKDVPSSFNRYSVSAAKGSTARDVVREVLNTKGIDYKLVGGSYIHTIDGLSEGDKGAKSGWMYMVNESHPEVGLANYYLEKDDHIVLHFSSDFTKEEGSEKWSGTPLPGEETGLVTKEVINSALNDMEKGKKDSLAVNLNFGSMKFDKDALTSIADQMKGDTLEIIIESVAVKNLNTQQTKAVGDRPVYDIRIVSGKKEITKFDGVLTISIPYKLKEGEKASGVVVYHLNDAGELIPMEGYYDAVTGNAIFTVNHLSYYVIGYDETLVKWPFTDVAEDDSVNWFYTPVKYVYEKGIFSGTGSATFSPNSPLTRSMLASVLARLSKADLTNYKEAPFGDVDMSSWYGPSVAWAKEMGIISGYKNPDGSYSFKPDANVSRQDIAVMINNYNKLVAKKTYEQKAVVTFTDDNVIGEYAKAAVTAMQQSGIISGMKNQDGSFRFSPLGNATRAEAATMIYNMLTLQ